MTEQIRAADDSAFRTIAKTLTDANYTIKVVTIDRPGSPPVVHNY